MEKLPRSHHQVLSPHVKIFKNVNLTYKSRWGVPVLSRGLRKLRIRLVSFVVMTQATCGFANADPLIQKLRGEYTAKSPWSMSLRTIVLGEENSAFAAEIIVGDKSCSGAMSGIGSSDGRVLKFKPYSSGESGGGQCEVTITLDKSGATATISESACSDYHGAQCLFKGALRAK